MGGYMGAKYDKVKKNGQRADQGKKMQQYSCSDRIYNYGQM
jgi:hypothetical protein